MKNLNESKTITITPQGLIFTMLGGYVGEETGMRSREKSNKVTKGLIDFMQKNNVALIIINGKLSFISVKEEKRKKFLGIF